MSAPTVDWLDSASALTQRLDRLSVPARRRTMLDGLLRVATTYARLACYLGARPHDDNAAEYDMVADDFNEATQDFQQNTLERVLGWTDSDAADGVAAEQGAAFETLAEGAEESIMSLGSSSLHIPSPGAEEYTLGEVEELRSTGSSPVSDQQWDPTEEFYTRIRPSLLADLEDPLLASLTEPLLQELSPRLGSSNELVSSIAVALCKDQLFLDTITARAREGLVGMLTGNHVMPQSSDGAPCGNTSALQHSRAGAPPRSLVPTPAARRDARTPDHPSYTASAVDGCPSKRDGSSSPLLLDVKRARSMVEKRRG
ncbi:hypothetical protein K466DRAFT_600434 [Polyporus arcularius HHB13444]|uniref:Uncharacterized protein n=1 Tax=Polyporus arcularius HHB13444 TaxID=1314778 RepID=A0A5C3PCG5_9APHY|nr:hypothetical protein K466DRAFT_600434 [Polyporus arcularius HHB13444]